MERLMSSLKGYALGFPAGSIFMLSQLPSVTLLTGVFAAASLIKGGVLLGRTGRNTPTSLGDVVVGASSGLCMGAVVMGAVHTVEVSNDRVQPQFMKSVVNIHEEPPAGVCVTPIDGPPPTAPACAPK